MRGQPSRSVCASYRPGRLVWQRLLVSVSCVVLLNACSVFRHKPDPGSPEAIAAEQAKAEKEERKRRLKEERRRHNPCDFESEDEVPVIDDTRVMLQKRTCTAALWLDGLFGDEGGDVEAAKRTHGFVQLNNTWSEFDGYNSRLRMRVEFDLPTMEDRLSAFIGRDSDEDFVRGRTENSELRDTFPTLDGQNQWLAGLGYSLPSSTNLQTQFRVGVRGATSPRAFVQSRVRYMLYSDDNDVAYLRTTPFWNTRDGFGVTQNFDFSHVLTPRHLLRWYTIGTISERSEGLNWRNSLVLYQNLNNRRGLAYEAFIRGETDEPEPLYEYGARVLFRHPFLKRRLYLEWAAGYSWPRIDPEKPRDGSTNIGLSLELPFGTDFVEKN